MLEKERQRFAEALAHWAEDVALIRARERAEAIAQAEDQAKVRLADAFHISDLSKHHGAKLRQK
ncbi:hypothetical protein AB688_18040 [Pseudomonas putida]|uniref:hypothetical protein n=1 Tax=Pseudomonas putida TaxID=303 RepID=UPI0007B6A698|nr:hypothetical protein [Pseudomonas putida]ANC03914.1 hypothetical protein AB688_18040 [Pseudomonas putida]